MNIDKMITCPKTGGNALVVAEPTPGIKIYTSFSSGYQTNTLMKEGEKFYEEQIEILPELYKDLIWKDPETELMWIPSMINIPEKGMVFTNGSSKEEWGWASVKAVPITEEEKLKYPIPNKKGKFYTYRMDMTTLKMFDERDFIGALEYIQLFPE